ncbi:MAG: anthranilate synthase component I family protein [Chitinophagaceae bacterium]|nr:anthranilate synthase component I family protein [Chitinophagaceae bacterium]
MKQTTTSFPIHNTELLKQQVLSWVSRFNICCFLDNHQYSSAYQSVECLAGAGAAELFSAETDVLPQLGRFLDTQSGWLFGHLNYDLKNEIEQLRSDHPDPVGFPTAFFFRPQVVLQLAEGVLTIQSELESPDTIFRQITAEPLPSRPEAHPLQIRSRLSKNDYISAVQEILRHIARGDCYELNFCQEFYSEHAVIDPLQVYSQLTAISPNPFSCFYKLDHRYLLCASPERYLQKKGNRILSQPIKGTFKRDPDPAVDAALKQQLQHSQKDRSENVMVVDLVRNDLSRICKEGSVQVSELFGIYSFPQVHQMISTITGELKEDTGLMQILQASFPMGSMTGAPKKSVMQLIERYERTKRGIYSGAVGYISPDKDFDFNVVIRSILYNAKDQYLGYQVGGAITAQSDPEKEYEECLLKAAAINKVIGFHP